MAERHSERSSRKQKIKEELIKYWLICAYLLVCFAILSLYRAAAEENVESVWVPLGMALVQALILGKFIMIGDALSVGRHADRHPFVGGPGAPRRRPRG